MTAKTKEYCLSIISQGIEYIELMLDEGGDDGEGELIKELKKVEKKLEKEL